MKCPVYKPAFFFFVSLYVLPMTVGIVPIWAEDNVHSAMAYERPDPEVVHQQLEEILSQNRYKPKKSFLQHLRDFFFGFEGKAPRISSKIGWFFFWVLMIWCCVTLLAILAHFIWSVVMMSRRGKVFSQSMGSDGQDLHDKTEKELHALIQQMVEAEDFYHAVKYLMLATLKKLDSKGILQFHASKTNGDYLLDFPQEHNRYPDFKICITVFEKCIYGKLMSSQAAYNQMKTLTNTFEEIE